MSPISSSNFPKRTQLILATYQRDQVETNHHHHHHQQEISSQKDRTLTKQQQQYFEEILNSYEEGAEI